LEWVWKYIQVMALTLDDPETSRLAEELALREGKTPAEIVYLALREHAESSGGASFIAREIDPEVLMAIGRHCASLPVLDGRSVETVIDWPI
jgi:hypothetical protein